MNINEKIKQLSKQLEIIQDEIKTLEELREESFTN
tara:strand:+ start:180 stop:284 length:105 start_codon:yes stop_codon:yes gene_type:complete